MKKLIFIVLALLLTNVVFAKNLPVRPGYMPEYFMCGNGSATKSCYNLYQTATPRSIDDLRYSIVVVRNDQRGSPLRELSCIAGEECHYTYIEGSNDKGQYHEGKEVCKFVYSNRPAGVRPPEGIQIFIYEEKPCRIDVPNQN